MSPSVLDLSRIQFAFTVLCHIIFPSLSIGLARFIAVFEGAWLRIEPSPLGSVHIPYRRLPVLATVVVLT
ncbi:cytochrome bd ubiquinol oxidase subunit I [Burkholderia sp. BT03]|nr:cytochrome bd ubiquinol oxidase subunit I [Burkholderia sp. BT03]SKC52111.1 Cytochrome bd terminal oxidase subunit I [Paraburkholderia hospita]